MGDSVRLLMNTAPHAMPAQIANDAKAAAPGNRLNRLPDHGDGQPGTHRVNSSGQRFLRCVAKALLLWRNRRHRGSCACVCPVTIQLCRDINIHQIAGLNHALSGDAVRGFVVHTDAGVAGEVICQYGRGARAVFFQKFRADRVQFGGSHAGAQRFLHVAQCQPTDAPDTHQTNQILF